VSARAGDSYGSLGAISTLFSSMQDGQRTPNGWIAFRTARNRQPPLLAHNSNSLDPAATRTDAPDPGVERPGSGFRWQGLLVTTVTLDLLRLMTYPAVNAPNPLGVTLQVA
jgi:hypothetical protein